MQLPEVFVVYSFFVFWHPGVLLESDYGARGLSAMALWPRVGRVLTETPFGSNPKKKGFHLGRRFDPKSIKVTRKLVKIGAGNRSRQEMISELSHGGPKWNANCKYHTF